MSETDRQPASKRAQIVGWVMSGLVIAFMIVDGAMKLVPLKAVTDSAVELGLPDTVNFARGLGVLGLVSTGLYAVPRTSALGAILLTGYLGGAIATQVRVDAPLFSNILFGVYLGALMWGGLYLRERRLRSLIPLRDES
jgi:hypothetical protein